MKQNSLWINTSDQQRLFVKTWGSRDKPVIIMVHGYPDHQAVWDSIINHLCEDYFVVTYDVRGAGQSSVPRKIRDYRLARLSLDLEEVAKAVIPNRTFHLVGHDWGSIQSWESATEPKFRQRILSFTTISGPCLDHAAFWMREQFSKNKSKFFKQLTKSWYIAVFQLPFLAPTVWQFFKPEWWSNIIERLEQQSHLPLNTNIQHDGQHGVNLYRANFFPCLIRPRARYAICPVQAIVLEQDQFVSPELVDEMQKWVNHFSRIQMKANHWAVLSQALPIARSIDQFVQQHQPTV
jgi:pimeloyl-ACP methyl ester carboxylesterase